MILTTVLSLIAWGQGALPGSTLSLQKAKEEARFIVVAEVGKTSDVIGGAVNNAGPFSFLGWTELKPSAVLKGEVNGEELNKHPLSIMAEGSERLPRTGDTLVFFIGDSRGDFSISKILPKTEANLTAIKAVMPPPRVKTEKGGLRQKLNVVGDTIGRGGLGDGMPALKPPVLKPVHPSYRGTTIVPDQRAEGDRLKLQNEFAAAMSRADPRPEDRQSHFAWLDKNEYVRRYGVSQIGWYGAVLGCEPRTGGGWTVKVVIRPWLYSTSLRHTLVADSVEETYEFVGGGVRLVGSNATTAKPGRQVFPLAF